MPALRSTRNNLTRIIVKSARTKNSTVKLQSQSSSCSSSSSKRRITPDGEGTRPRAPSLFHPGTKPDDGTQMSASWVRQRIAGTQSLPVFTRWIALGIEDDEEHEDEDEELCGNA
jgi:hypothetical protein